MTVLKENEYNIQVFTDEKIMKLKIDELLSAFREGYKFEPMYQAGKSDGKNRYYKTTIIPNKGIYFEVGVGFKQRLLDNIPFNNIETFPHPEQQGMEFLKRVAGHLPFKPYKHQLKAFMGLISNRNHLAIAATGAGKSLILYLVARYFWEKNMKVVVVVPTIGLTSQLFSDFEDYLDIENKEGEEKELSQKLISDIKLIGGENKDKELNKPIIVSTWQSLNKIMSEIDNYDAIIVDEAHQAKASVLQEILRQKCSVKIGMTGSMPIIKTDAMALEQALGKPTRYVNARELMDLNLLTDTTIVPMFLKHPRNETISGMKYQEEVKFIRQSVSRTNFINTFMKGLKGVSVALYQVTEHGEQTYEALTGVKLTTKKKSDFEMMKELGVFFMSGSTKSSVREKIRVYLNECENAIVIGQMAVLSTGINIPRLKNLVFLSSTKSYTLILQSIGRVMRLHKEKGNNVYIFDMIDEFTYKKDSYSLKHYYQREAFYESEGHPLIEKEIDLSKYQ